MAGLCLGPVAFIDLLGFKEYVDSASGADLRLMPEKYAGAIRSASTYASFPKTIRNDPRGDAEEEARGPKEDDVASLQIYYTIFSDCLVMYEMTHPEWPWPDQRSLNRIIRCCSALSYSLLEIGRPFRGCIAYGEYCVHYDKWPRGTIVAGKPLVEAYELEQQLECIGIVVHPSAARECSIDGAAPPDGLHLQSWADLNPEDIMLTDWHRSPFKDGCPLAVNEMRVPAVLPVCLPTGQRPESRGFAGKVQRDLESAIACLEKMKSDLPPESTNHHKYDATLELYKRVHKERADLIGQVPWSI